METLAQDKQVHTVEQDKPMTEKPYKRPEHLTGRTECLKTPCGSLYLTLNEDNGVLREVRLTLGKSGTCYNIMLQTIALFISVMLQSNISREKIKKTLLNQFEGNCGQTIWQEGEKYNSCLHFLINRILEDMASRGEICLEESVSS
jgi:ribonucleoside-diphosphate reductase alpha chain